MTENDCKIAIMKRFLQIAGIVLLVASVVSLAPVAGLYLSKEPAPYTNAQAAEKLAANKGDSFRFLVFSDSHAGLVLSDSAFLKTVRNMNREDRFKKTPVDFAVSSGDITFRGSIWDFHIFNIIRSRIKWPVICSAGNHDDDNRKVKDLFKKYCGSNAMSFVDRNSYFITIDNTITNITEKQFIWLEAELEKSQAYAHRFVIMHKPPVSPYQQAWYRPEQGVWPYKFMKLCEKYKVDVVFTGHEHMFKKSSYGGVKYVTAGGAGMPMDIPTSEGGYQHYVVVRVLGDYVDLEVRKVFPPLWEYLCYYMWKDIFYTLRSVLI